MKKPSDAVLEKEQSELPLDTPPPRKRSVRTPKNDVSEEKTRRAPRKKKPAEPTETPPEPTAEKAEEKSVRVKREPKPKQSDPVETVEPKSPDTQAETRQQDDAPAETDRPRRENRRGRGRRGNRRPREDGPDNNGPREDNRPPRPEPVPYDASGYFECSPRGYGFLRRKERAFYQTNSDVFVPPDMARDYGLREGLHIDGIAQNGPRGPQLVELKQINGEDPANWSHLPEFEELTAINPNKRVILETDNDRLTTRVIDLVTPIGRGQRGLIVAPPRTGKTTILKHIAQAVRDKNPDTHLMILLIDERPEEVTDFKRSIPEAELFASSNDSDTHTHARIAHFAIERAKRLAESGRHVFIVMDSITRLARAANNNMGRKGGKTMSGGIDSKALEFPRRLFAAARCTREAGSLTIIATALIETGSRMDDLIYQEFKGTGNMELVLDRKIAEMYVYPAVNIFRSGTRREELLLPAFQLEKIHFLRRGLSGNKPADAIERLITLMKRFDTNNQMMVEIKTSSI